MPRGTIFKMISNIEVKFKEHCLGFDILRDKFSAKINFNDRDIKTLTLPLSTVYEWSKDIPQRTKLFFNVHENEPLLQLLGFKITYADLNFHRRYEEVIDIFDNVYKQERNKENYLLLQHLLLEESFDEEAKIDTKYLKEIDFIYPIAIHNFF